MENLAINKVDWFFCPICSQKLLKVDRSKAISGVFCKCKKCKSEIEVTNKIQ